MSLDRYLDDFGRELSRARPRRQPRAAFALAGAAALAAAVAFLPARSGGVDAVAEARAALAPPGEIVHMVVRVKIGPRQVGPPTEQWYAADPARWRMVSEVQPAGPGRDPAPARFEMAYFNDRMRTYDAQRDVVRIWPAIPEMSGAPGILGGDPASDLRKMLAAGDVRDDGVVTFAGRQVRRLVVEQKSGPPRRLVYYMDPQTFAPVGGRMYLRLNGKRRSAPIEFTVDRYERLPINTTNEKLLRFPTTPDTRYVWHVRRR